MRTRSLAFELPRRRRLALLGAAFAVAVLAWAMLAMPAHARATASTTVRLDGVRTTLTTDPATTTLLFTAGIIPLPVSPTSIVPTADAARYVFPVTGGAVNAKSLAGSITHSGGILLAERTKTNGWKSLSLTKFTIVISKAPHISAVVNGGKRLTIATLDLSKAKIARVSKDGRTYVSVAGVTVDLNATAVGAINSTFGTALAAPIDHDTARVLVRVAR
jgi:hypothetical protein